MKALFSTLQGSSPLDGKAVLDPVLLAADVHRDVCALGAAFYGDAHLPGAINIPPGQVDRLAGQLIPDLDSPVVVYCGGSCSSAEAVAGRLERVGYKRKSRAGDRPVQGRSKDPAVS